MSLPWRELGLSTLCIPDATGLICVDLETGEEVGGATSQTDALLIDYSENAAHPTEAHVLDLRLLARALFPGLSDDRYETVRAHLALDTRDPDRPRALEIGSLFSALLEEAARLDKAVLAMLAQLFLPPISDVLRHVLLLPQVQETGTRSLEEVPQGDELVIPESLDAALNPEGAIAAGFDSFETRDGQRAMADAVERTMREGGALLAEAGPGTGKTFAYLIPALLHLKRTPSDRIVVSTRTRQLQEQLFFKDLPFLVPRLHPDVRIALLKGRENYLCKRRWQSFVAEVAESLEHDRLQWMTPLVRWMVETETGDIEENSAFQSDPRARSLWSRLNDSAHHCTGAFCPFEEECFSIQARRAARRADLVVVNHSLLLADLVVDGVILGKYTRVVFDEAHTLEAVARMAFTRSLSERRVERLADDLSPTARRRRGWLHRTTFSGGAGDVERVQELLAALRRSVTTVFSQLDREFQEERRAEFRSLLDATSDVGELSRLLVQLEDALDRLVEHVTEPEPLKELEGYVRTAQEIAGVLQDLSAPPNENAVHWYERFTRSLELNATPLDVAPFLRRALYPKVSSIVLTSATLSVGGSFEFIQRTLGLDEFPDVRSMTADSPFDYRERMRILMPADLPPVYGAPEPFAVEVAAMIVALADATERNGLVLFTSYALMQAVRKHLPERLHVLVQQESSRTALIDRFRDPDRTAWLLGTESFWEGVDFPGSQLEVLVITRLPFPVPTDPVFAAMARKAETEGKDGFMDLSLPLAALKLRQGVGRLIRTTSDHGLVILTDERVIKRGYGRTIAASLPVPIEMVGSIDDVTAAASAWFSEHVGDAEPLTN